MGITIKSQIGTFINYGELKVSQGNQWTQFNNGGYIGEVINYGIAERMIWIHRDSGVGAFGVGAVTNYGTMGGISSDVKETILTLNNLGTIKPIWSANSENSTHLKAEKGAKILIKNYRLFIDESANTFNNNGNGKNLSHLMISVSDGGSVSFKDAKSKILLDFGANFELGKEYLIAKLVTDTGGKSYTALGVDFSRLSTYNDIYTLTKSGANGFKAEITPQYGTIGTLYKSNIRTMNNFDLISNAMIYPNKYK
ncbi:hypothetical protein ACWIUD_11955, partial [Helicobacter sp. 23-1044]